jgi:hypothetical protein
MWGNSSSIKVLLSILGAPKPEIGSCKMGRSTNVLIVPFFHSINDCDLDPHQILSVQMFDKINQEIDSLFLDNDHVSCPSSETSQGWQIGVAIMESFLERIKAGPLIFQKMKSLNTPKLSMMSGLLEMSSATMES